MIRARRPGWTRLDSRRAQIVLGLATLGALRATAQQPPTAGDSVPVSGFLSSGAIVAGTGLILGAFLIDRSNQVELQEDRTAGRNSFARIGNAFGDPKYFGPAIIGAYLLGHIAGRPPITSAAIRTAQTVVFASAASLVVKIAVGRYRPDQGGDPDVFKPFSGKSSFPSGHTTAAFALAASVAGYTDRLWLKSALFAGAGLTGFARMNDDKHWLSDVLAGAAVGVLTERLTARIARSRRVAISPAGVAVQVPF